MKETKKTKIRTVPVLGMDIFEYDVGSRYFRVVAEFTMFPMEHFLAIGYIAIIAKLTTMTEQN